MRFEDLTLIGRWDTEPERDEIPEAVLEAIAEMIEREAQA